MMTMKLSRCRRPDPRRSCLRPDRRQPGVRVWNQHTRNLQGSGFSRASWFRRLHQPTRNFQPTKFLCICLGYWIFLVGCWTLFSETRGGGLQAKRCQAIENPRTAFQGQTPPADGFSKRRGVWTGKVACEFSVAW